MREEHLKKIILFYFFVTLNEARARELARKSWLWCQRKKYLDAKADPDVLVLLALQSGWDSIKNEIRTGVTKYSMDSGWLLPKGLSLEPWKAFQKEASEEELFVTVLTTTLKYSIESIEKTLGLSSGTIRYRMAKATRRMGTLVPNNGKVS